MSTSKNKVLVIGPGTYPHYCAGAFKMNQWEPQVRADFNFRKDLLKWADVVIVCKLQLTQEFLECFRDLCNELKEPQKLPIIWIGYTDPELPDVIFMNDAFLQSWIPVIKKALELVKKPEEP